MNKRDQYLLLLSVLLGCLQIALIFRKLELRITYNLIMNILLLLMSASVIITNFGLVNCDAVYRFIEQNIF